jgi:hypothetical protein
MQRALLICLSLLLVVAWSIDASGFAVAVGEVGAAAGPAASLAAVRELEVSDAPVLGVLPAVAVAGYIAVAAASVEFADRAAEVWRAARWGAE